ncbi:MAG: DUF4923 family protein [Phocaeicola sp.]
MLKQIVVVLSLLFCGSTVVSAQSLKDILSGVVSSVVDNKVTTEQSILGVWSYLNPECKFKSDNLLSQAGGAVVTKSVQDRMETVLGKIGISAGKFSCEFRNDGTYAFAVGTKSLEGTYTFDSENKRVTLITKLGVTFDANVITSLDGKTLSLLFDADKMLALLKTISSVATSKVSSSTTLNAFALLINQYDGLQLGFAFEKR